MTSRHTNSDYSPIANSTPTNRTPAVDVNPSVPRQKDSYHSLVDSSEIKKTIYRKNRTVKYIHYSKVATQEERDQYNKQQRLYRVERRKNDPRYKEKLREARQRNKDKVNKYQRDRYSRQKALRALANKLGQLPPPSKPPKQLCRSKVLSKEQKEATKLTQKTYYKKNPTKSVNNKKSVMREQPTPKNTKRNKRLHKRTATLKS